MKTQILYQRENTNKELCSQYNRQEVIALFLMLNLLPQFVEMDYDENRNRLDKLHFYFLKSETDPIESKILSRETIQVSYFSVLESGQSWKNYLEIANSKLRGGSSGTQQ